MYALQCSSPALLSRQSLVTVPQPRLSPSMSAPSLRRAPVRWEKEHSRRQSGLTRPLLGTASSVDEAAVDSGHGSIYTALNATYPIALLINQIADELLRNPPPSLRGREWTPSALKRRLSSVIIGATGGLDGTPVGFCGLTRSAGDQALIDALDSQAAWLEFDRAVRRTCEDCNVSDCLTTQLLAAVRVALALQHPHRALRPEDSLSGSACSPTSKAEAQGQVAGESAAAASTAPEPAEAESKGGRRSQSSGLAASVGSRSEQSKEEAAELRRDREAREAKEAEEAARAATLQSAADQVAAWMETKDQHSLRRLLGGSGRRGGRQDPERPRERGRGRLGELSRTRSPGRSRLTGV